LHHDHSCVVFPLLPGKTEEARAFQRELDTARKAEYDRSERQIGMTKPPAAALEKVVPITREYAECMEPRLVIFIATWRCLFNDPRRTEVSGSRIGPVPPGDASRMPPFGA
jgi:hypothetical protein